MRIETLTGDAVVPFLPHLARLRREVFFHWPYLYAGREDEESRYLDIYARRPGFGLILALDGDTPVGAATCLPLAEENEAVQAPFRQRGLEVSRFCYFAESVLLPAWRGSGIGVAFFQAREAHARALESDFAAFCSVVRPADHPARPEGATDLHEFWRHRGFSPYPDLQCTMRWTDVGDDVETEKQLAFWLKSLSGAPLP